MRRELSYQQADGEGANLKSIILGAAAAILTVISPAVGQTVWQLDPPHSSAQFAVTHMGISTVRGAFDKLSGTVRYDEADPKKDSVDVTIEARSIDTRVDMRDNDLRSDHFFDVSSRSQADSEME